MKAVALGPQFQHLLRQLGEEIFVVADDEDRALKLFEGLKKQDRERSVGLKVKNWGEFSRGLTELGIEKRAFGYPL